MNKKLINTLQNLVEYYTNGVLKEKDIIRQNRLITYLNCKFYRIREKTNEIFKVDNLLENYTTVIQNILNKERPLICP
jgi:hypothetical protein